MTSPPPVLSIRNAQKSYGKAPALRGIDLDLYPGELLGFLGPNGAGKTTLIRCVSGRAKLDAGEIRIESETGRSELLGVVPQTIALYKDLTVKQNLTAFGKLHGVGRSQLQERVDAALAWSSLSDRETHLTRTLSGGMQRRLNIACSVLHRPAILLLDEPTVGVDPQSRERIHEMLRELRQQGTAILLTTHQLDEAQFRCDRIAIVDQGQIVRTGTLDQLITETVGKDQWLRIRFHSPPSAPSAALTMDASRTMGSCVISDVTNELPRVLESLQASAKSIDHLVLEQPTLQDVFLHLTGKELRE